MKKIYISENIQFLFKKEKNLTQDEFGEMFNIGKGLISNYINEKALPKIETLINICDYYKLTLDELVRTSLIEKNYRNKDEEKLSSTHEPPEGYGIIHLKYVEMLEKSNEDKDKLIKQYEEKLEIHEKNSSA